MKVLRLMAYLFGLFLAASSVLTLVIRIAIRTAAGDAPFPTDSGVLMVFLAMSATMSAILITSITERSK